MKFGLESEKFLFNLRNNLPSEGVFSFLDALSDFDPHSNGKSEIISKISNEFVLNMVEIGTTPSEQPLEVLKEYLLSYLMLQMVAFRESVAVVSLGSLPMEYTPHMTPKWAYYVQNTILDNKKQTSWMMSKNSPLKAAGNCAGIHVHSEIHTAPEFLYSNRELQDKFNMGLMLTPMIAFSSSPYFFGAHEAISMRGFNYFTKVYKDFPLNGHLPPVMESSAETLQFFQNSISTWIEKGVALGLPKQDLQRLTSNKGANWNPIRWNRQWNTIELRCLDSDRIDLDCSKFIWASNVMKRMDIHGEALQCEPIRSEKEVDAHMVEDCFKVSGGKVSILPTEAIQKVFHRAIKFGTKDELVGKYLQRMSSFAQVNMKEDEKSLFDILQNVLDTHQTTSSKLLAMTGNQTTITNDMAVEIIKSSINHQMEGVEVLKKKFPDVFTRLQKMSANDFFV